MTPKKLDKEKLKQIKKVIGKKEFLTKEEVKEMQAKFGFCRSIMYRELIENKITFQSGSALCTMRSMGLETDGKTVAYKNLQSLSLQKLELLKNMKTKVLFKCKVCSSDSKIKISNMLNRNYFRFEPYCPKCILKEITNTEEWCQKNSKAQKVAQNLPEQKEKNRQAQIERFKNEETREAYKKKWKEKWSNPDFRESIKTKASKKSLEKWSDPNYAKKVIENSKSNYKSGFYNGLYYQSGYELAFLLKCENEKGNLDHVKRCHFGIRYNKKNGKFGYYYPDYILHGKFLIEVKGYGPWVDFELLEAKNKAAQKWCKEEKMKFRIVNKLDLTYFWIRKAKTKHEELKLNEAKNEKGI